MLVRLYKGSGSNFTRFIAPVNGSSCNKFGWGYITRLSISYEELEDLEEHSEFVEVEIEPGQLLSLWAMCTHYEYRLVDSPVVIDSWKDYTVERLPVTNQHIGSISYGELRSMM